MPTLKMCRKGAFTLVELLVVIGIIAILIGLLLPVLGKARRQAKMLNEMAASRQLMLAYLLYTNDNRGWLLPGHIPTAVAGVDDLGQPLSPLEVTRRWPWRLVPSIKYAMKGSILVNEQAEALSNRDMPMWTYMVSITPSLGYNFYCLGGDQVLGYEPYLRKITQATQTTRRIVFASARFPGSDGYWKIVPPTKSFEYSADGWTHDPYSEAGEPGAWGFVHPRWKGKAVVAHLDGHSELLTIDELRDMTRWSEDAAKAGNPNWDAN